MRKPLSKKLRFEIFERDNFFCQYCGKTPDKDKVVLQVDHIVSVKNGGKNDKENLITACFDCNMGKGAKTTIKGKITPEDIKQELVRTQERLDQVVAMNKATKKIEAITKKIEKEKDAWLFSLLPEYNDKLHQKLQATLKRSFPDCSRDKIKEALGITVARDFDTMESFIKYFTGVLRNITLSEDDQNALRLYNGFCYSKGCKLYKQTRKFILENSYLGEEFHQEVLANMDDNFEKLRHKTFSLRKEVQHIFNKQQFTVNPDNELNLNLHICDTIQMLLEEK